MCLCIAMRIVLFTPPPFSIRTCCVSCSIQLSSRFSPLRASQVSTPQQARAIVSASRFPPVGTRGFGSPFTQASWGLSTAEYLRHANDGVLVLVQVETRQALENIEEICGVDGLGACFVCCRCGARIQTADNRSDVPLGLRPATYGQMASSSGPMTSPCHWACPRQVPARIPRQRRRYKRSCK